MRKYKSLIALAVVLVVLVAAYIIVTKVIKFDDNTTDKPNIETIRITDGSKDDINKLTITNAGGTLIFEQKEIEEKVETKNEDGTVNTDTVKKIVWQPISPAGWSVDSNQVNSVAINAISMTADKLIEENAQDLSAYGLDKPQATIKMELKDGSVVVLELGSLTPTGGAYYAKTADKNTVYTVGTYTASRLLSNKVDLMNKSVLEGDYTTITELSMTRNSVNVFSGYKKSDLEWEITEPILCSADESIFKMLDSISKITASSFVETELINLEKYGLDKPNYEFEYTMGDEKLFLKLGKKISDGSEIYATLGKEVFVLSTSNLTFMDKPIEEIINPFVYLPNIQGVSRLEVHMDGRVDVSIIKADLEDKKNDSFIFNGKEISGDEALDKLYRKYYQGVIGTRVETVEPDAQPSGKPEFTFVYTSNKDNSVTTVELIPKDESLLYAMRNGVYTGLTVSKKPFDEKDDDFPGLRQAYENLTKALEEKEKSKE